MSTTTTPGAVGAPLSPGAEPWRLYTPRQRNLFLFVLFLVGTSNYVDRNIVGVLLEPIKAEFGVSDAMLGLLSGLSFALFYATLGIPVARWADRGDRRFVITLALTVWSLMTVLCGMAQNFWQLAAARVGVGVGEAGAIPPAQSLIADYFPPDQRAKALGAYLMCSIAGYILGLVAGGWIAVHYGWRAAFIIVGLPGLALALVTRTVLREPRLAGGTLRPPAGGGESVMATFRILMRKPSYRNMIYSMTFYFLVSYGALIFLASFMVRVHQIDLATVGMIIGIQSAVGAVIGNLAGGALADKLAKRDPAWLARMPGWGLLLVAPFYQVAFLMPDMVSMLAVLSVTGIVLTGAVPSMFSALHVVCGSPRRAMAVALVFFFANLIGLGLGPVATGLISDMLAPSLGPAESLRYALIIILLALVPSGIFMLRAARHLNADAEP
ncbi:spinster family MFS transporter [Niveispirillum fermenti]|uniref:spinster family MFS transporter n=1 Tax=Niveispirillum fermenti TaxID=1233113 RepID=UPI003A87358B